MHKTRTLAHYYLFMVGAVVILTITAALKIRSAMTMREGILDPLFGLDQIYVLTLVGAVEGLAVLILVLFWSKPNVQLIVLGWIVCNFLIYRGAMFWLGIKDSCLCGGVDRAITNSGNTILFINIALGYLSLGTLIYGLLFYLKFYRLEDLQVSQRGLEFEIQ